MDKYNKANIIKDCRNLIKKIEKLKLYMLKIYEIDIIKSKIYFSNYIFKRKNQQLIIMIIYNKYIFFANNKICKI